MDSVQRENLECSVLNGRPSDPSSQGSGSYAEEEAERLSQAEVTDDAKETVSSRRDTLVHIGTQRVFGSTRDLHRFKSCEVPALGMRSGRRVPTLTTHPEPICH